MVPVVVIALGLLAACRGAPPPAADAGRPSATGPAIVHFYAYPMSVARGQSAQLCYGVENASSARVDPMPGNVPAYANRCFEVEIQRTTDFVLTAADRAGKTTTRSLRVSASAAPARMSVPAAPKPEEPPKPRVTAFSASPAEVAREGHVTLCYETADATAVRIEPPVVDFRLPARGCLGHAPERSTTYRLTASSAAGSDTREVSVTVR